MHNAISTKLGRVLSIDPRTERIAWTYFKESTIRDQRMHSVRSGEPSVRVREIISPYLVALLDDVKPHALLVPEINAVGTRRRSQHVTDIVVAVMREAEKRGIAVHVVSVNTIRECLLDKEHNPIRNKRDIHRCILEEYPEMRAALPRPA
jgi:hypothetical protein